MKNHTSWQKVSKWYTEKQGLRGSYYYEKIILPRTLSLLNLKPADSVLDLGCGQGILERIIPTEVGYAGIDLSSDLIKFAIANRRFSKHEFIVGDITKPLPVSSRALFSKIVILLTLQNISNLSGLVKNIKKYLKPDGQVIIVINHPYFRIPRQSGWGIDEENKLQFRRVNRYQTSFKIPIEMHPGQTNKEITWSFHYPLSLMSAEFEKNNLVVSKIEEWVSDKKSVGKAARMENFARAEFPLFMALVLKAC